MAHPGWVRARADALAALSRGEGVAVLGRAGTGKSLLLQAIAAELRGRGEPVRTVLHGEVPAEGGDGVLVVDEAGGLGAEALAALCRLGRPFVVAGLPGMERRLAGCGRRIEAVRLEPLAPEEVARFVAARLAATGRPRDLFEPEAVLALAHRSAGLFRLVVVLAGAALFLAEQEGAARVGQRHVDDAAVMRDGLAEEEAEAESAIEPAPEPPLAAPEPPPVAAAPVRFRGARWLGVALAGAGLALGLVWAVAFRHGASPPPMRAVAEAPSTAPAQVPAPAPAPAPPPQAEAPPSAPMPQSRPEQPSVALAFRGPVMNDTIGQGGQLELTLRTRGQPGPVTAHFHAFAGLIGTGELTGTLAADGRLTLSGRLMMGRNPFDCTLSAMLAGDRLAGSASFVRPTGGEINRSRFTLGRI